MVRASEFYQISSSTTSEQTFGGSKWLEKVAIRLTPHCVNAISPLVRHPQLVIKVGVVVVTLAIALVAIAQSEGPMIIKFETDGDRIKNEIIIDPPPTQSQSSQPE